MHAPATRRSTEARTLSPRARRGNVLTGCLVALVIVIVLVVGGVVYVAMNWRGWAADITSDAAIEMVRETDLPESEKTEVVAQIEDLAAGFKRGDVTIEEMGRIFESLMESPLVPAAIVHGARKGYLEESGLSEEEQEAGELALARLAHGVYIGDISPDELEAVFEPIEDRGRTGSGVHIDHPDFRLHLKAPEACTDEELREVIDNARAAADGAGVAESPPAIDVSDEIQKAIDSALGESTEASGEAEPEKPEAAGEESESQEPAEGGEGP